MNCFDVFPRDFMKCNIHPSSRQPFGYYSNHRSDFGKLMSNYMLTSIKRGCIANNRRPQRVAY